MRTVVGEEQLAERDTAEKARTDDQARERIENEKCRCDEDRRAADRRDVDLRLRAPGRSR
jgi:hypothetical protein